MSHKWTPQTQGSNHSELQRTPQTQGIMLSHKGHPNPGESHRVKGHQKRRGVRHHTVTKDPQAQESKH